jgi:predicted DNA-binding transcriptional regulator AlpA
MNDLMTLDDIAELVGLPRPYVRDTLVKQPEFPPPAIRLSQRIRKWQRAAVCSWLDRHAKAQAR